jgi:hypothetical protein
MEQEELQIWKNEVIQRFSKYLRTNNFLEYRAGAVFPLMCYNILPYQVDEQYEGNILHGISDGTHVEDEYYTNQYDTCYDKLYSMCEDIVTQTRQKEFYDKGMDEEEVEFAMEDLWEQVDDSTCDLVNEVMNYYFTSEKVKFILLEKYPIMIGA